MSSAPVYSPARALGTDLDPIGRIFETTGKRIISADNNSGKKGFAEEEVTHRRNVPRVVLGIKPSGKPRRYHERSGAAYGRSLMQTEAGK